jgi:hypothetical protein
MFEGLLRCIYLLLLLPGKIRINWRFLLNFVDRAGRFVDEPFTVLNYSGALRHLIAATVTILGSFFALS